MLGDDVLDHLLGVSQDRVPQVGALQDLAALLVDDVAVDVHHVVVLEGVLADAEVVLLDLLLRSLDGFAQKAGLERLMFGPAPERPATAVAKETPELIFQGKVELRFAGVALAAGAAPQLPVDAPALVALRPDDRQPAHGAHFI